LYEVQEQEQKSKSKQSFGCGRASKFAFALPKSDLVILIGKRSATERQLFSIDYKPRAFGWTYHLDLHRTSVLGVATSRRKLMRAPLTPLVVFNLNEKPKRSTEVIVASVASIPAWDPASRIIEVDGLEPSEKSTQ